MNSFLCKTCTAQKKGNRPLADMLLNRQTRHDYPNSSRATSWIQCACHCPCCLYRSIYILIFMHPLRCLASTHVAVLAASATELWMCIGTLALHQASLIVRHTSRNRQQLAPPMQPSAVMPVSVLQAIWP